MSEYQREFKKSTRLNAALLALIFIPATTLFLAMILLGGNTP